ncbi:MAG: UDP-3-O-(3-hydroxymyristoyl)glucosamine N-acyltransferase [Pseudomonadota bacterium]|nr:UDP-3-O-(3-hydroxymyristoyl)glucosamine N-acyltransferase [Pseudomonadota bacterium]
MADPRFHRRAGPFTLGELAARTKLFKLPEGAEGAVVTDVAPLETAGAGDLSFLDNRQYLKALAATAAGFCVVAPEFADRVPQGSLALVTPHPYLAYATIAGLIYPEAAAVAGVHPSAVVDASAVLGEGVQVAAGAVICARAEIGQGSVIGPSVTVGEGVIIGAGCRIDANVSLECCILGDRVHAQSGARIGTAGFGFAPHPERHVPVPQIGRVIIGNDCQIGANSCIARGSGHDTIVGDNVWIDNLVQIAHNVEIGSGSILVAQVGIAGSARLGRFVQAGGQSGIAGHIRLGDGVRIGAKSGVMNDQDAGATILGQPAVPVREFWRQLAALKRLSEKKGKGE